MGREKLIEDLSFDIITTRVRNDTCMKLVHSGDVVLSLATATNTHFGQLHARSLIDPQTMSGHVGILLMLAWITELICSVPRLMARSMTGYLMLDSAPYCSDRFKKSCPSAYDHIVHLL